MNDPASALVLSASSSAFSSGGRRRLQHCRYAAQENASGHVLGNLSGTPVRFKDGASALMTLRRNSFRYDLPLVLAISISRDPLSNPQGPGRLAYELSSGSPRAPLA